MEANALPSFLLLITRKAMDEVIFRLFFLAAQLALELGLTLTLL